MNKNFITKISIFGLLSLSTLSLFSMEEFAKKPLMAELFEKQKPKNNPSISAFYTRHGIKTPINIWTEIEYSNTDECYVDITRFMKRFFNKHKQNIQTFVDDAKRKEEALVQKEKTLNFLRSRFDTLTKNHENLIKEIEIVQEQKLELETNFSELRENSQKLEEKNLENVKRIKELEVEAKKFENGLALHISTIEPKLIELHRLTKQNQDLQVAENVMENSLKSQIESKNKELELLNKQNQELQNEARVLKNRLNGYEDQLQAKNNELNDLSRGFETTLKEQLDQKNNALQNKSWSLRHVCAVGALGLASGVALGIGMYAFMPQLAKLF